eukprot:TRINITY_DN12688_c0_g1_i1.p1 TRINITY_DN12688_c0_g1~~TRINITY_DN12688_c0_g1_i1.p1  ORF type:complete len:301 (-),score=87.72 TRINITY_DN12688_c0_g1_i1:60-962(-)
MGVINVFLGLCVAYQFLPTSLFWVATFGGFVWLWYWTSQGMGLRRKTQIASWGAPSEGNIYAKQYVDATNLLKLQKELAQKNPKTKMTITHFVGKACGLALNKAPSVNGRLLFGRFCQEESTDISFLIATEGGQNLAPKCIRNIDQKPVSVIAEELNAGVSSLRSGTDVDFKKNMDLVKILPTFVLSIVSEVIGFVSGDLGIAIPAIGLQARQFGTAMVTNVGVFGVEEAYAPFTPFARVPIIFLIGSIVDKPVVRDGKIVILPIMKVMGTMDHRFIDGALGAKISTNMKELLENPERLL